MGKVIVTVHGAVDADVLDRTLAALEETEASVELVIDLRDARSIDGRGAEVLVEATRRHKARGGALVLSAPRPGVAEVLAGYELTIEADLS